MFTGIIEEKGRLLKVLSGRNSGSIDIAADKVLEGTRIGDSIAVNGVCLTVTAMHHKGFTADVMPETLRRTNLGMLMPGAEVNLERAMAAGGRFGGHIVSGHVDGVGKINSLKAEGNAVWVSINANPAILHMIVEKGSICIDGISLTVAYVDEKEFKVSIIPHTGSETTLLSKRAGDIVNLENDIVGKYIARLMQPYARGNANAGNKYTGNALSDGMTVRPVNGVSVGQVEQQNVIGGNTGTTGGITMEMLAEYGI